MLYDYTFIIVAITVSIPSLPSPNASPFQSYLTLLTLPQSSPLLALLTLTLTHTHTPTLRAVPSGVFICQTTCQNGSPPQIKDLKWSPGQQFTEYITRDHSGRCDLLCTAGDRHIRVWSFRRPGSGFIPAAVVGGQPKGPQPPVPVSLIYKGLTVGKVPSAKIYTCCSFVFGNDKGDVTYDVVAGGSNGLVYLWRGGLLVAHTSAIKGGVLCIHAPPAAGSDRVYCGGARGVLKVLDAYTLNIVASFSAMSSSSISRCSQVKSRQSSTH